MFLKYVKKGASMGYPRHGTCKFQHVHETHSNAFKTADVIMQDSESYTASNTKFAAVLFPKHAVIQTLPARQPSPAAPWLRQACDGVLHNGDRLGNGRHASTQRHVCGCAVSQKWKQSLQHLCHSRCVVVRITSSVTTSASNAAFLQVSSKVTSSAALHPRIVTVLPEGSNKRIFSR